MFLFSGCLIAAVWCTRYAVGYFSIISAVATDSTLNANDNVTDVQDNKQRSAIHRERIKDEYRYWAKMAKNMHLKYKIYSMGLIKESLFDYPDDSQKYSEQISKAYAEFKKIFFGDFVFNSSEYEEEHIKLLHKLAWLEHRRWNAFMRVKGFRYTKDYDVYLDPSDKGSYKQMDIKLHPCLVECDQKGMRANMSSKGVVDRESCFQCDERDDFDLLDDLSYDLYEKKYINKDFKGI